MTATQSQALGSQLALAELCRLYWSPLCMFALLRGLLREEIGRNVSDQAETDEELLLAPPNLKIETSFCEAIRTANQQRSVSLEKRAEATYAEYHCQKRVRHEDVDSDCLFGDFLQRPAFRST